ncbi:YwdI family protein [Neobacillus sp.]|uniref:YwdI family protein n=1 Tax=Neobacillus sp. TaxID=2675273 RepID=UPI00289C0FDA|nr:YwdI family protein [Neobacillus sp.]
MNISIQTLLTKIEEELKLAQGSAKQESLREKVYSIKILCELILDEKQAVKTEVQLNSAVAIPSVIAQQAYQQPVMNQQVFQQPASLQQAKKLEMDDEANGDSLLDF